MPGGMGGGMPGGMGGMPGGMGGMGGGPDMSEILGVSALTIMPLRIECMWDEWGGTGCEVLGRGRGVVFLLRCIGDGGWGCLFGLLSILALPFPPFFAIVAIFFHSYQCPMYQY